MPDQSISTAPAPQPVSANPQQPQAPGSSLEPRVVTMPKQFTSAAKATSNASPRSAVNPVMVLVVVLLVGIAGGVGWWVWQSQKPASSVPQEQAVNTEQEEQSASVETQPANTEVPSFLSAIAKGPSGEMLVSAKLVLPPDAPQSITLTGESLYESSMISEENGETLTSVGGHFIISPATQLTSSATLSITLAPQEFILHNPDKLTLAVWEPNKKMWIPLENAFVYKDQATVTASIMQLSNAYYAVVKRSKEELAQTGEPGATTTEEPISTESTKLVMAADDDEDLLTYLEEFLYGTDPMDADTDGDSYNDGVEVRNGYTPRESGSAKLAADDKATVYTNTKFKYTVLYPASWVSAALDEKTQDQVVFTAPTGEFIQLASTVADKVMGLQALLAKEGKTAQFGAIKKFDDLEMSLSQDGKQWYVKIGNVPYVFSVSYDIGTKTQANFLTTFEMMARSIRMTNAK